MSPLCHRNDQIVWIGGEVVKCPFLVDPDHIFQPTAHFFFRVVEARFDGENLPRLECGFVIGRIAEEGGYTSIFVGSRGNRGLKRMLLGSVADDVIRHAHCPVTIIR